MSRDQTASETPGYVNYSTARLQEEYEQRVPIRSALDRLRKQYDISGRKVVELGSGLGFNLEVFQDSNEVLGVEGLASAAAQASARGIRTLAVDLHGDLPLESASVDVCLCLDVLEHLLHPELCVREIARIVKPSGLVVVNVPNHFSLAGRLRILFGSGGDSLRLFPEHSDWNNPHVRFFRRHTIVALLAQSGLVVREDWSAAFPSIPFVQRFASLRNSRPASWLAARRPSLFAGGFFLVATKPAS